MTRSLKLTLLLAAVVASATAQSIPFRIQAQEGSGTPLTLANASTLGVLSTSIGTPVSLNLTFTYTGSTAASITGNVQYAGSPDFVVGDVSSVPLNLVNNSSFSIPITFKPSAATAATGVISIPYSVSGATAGQPATVGSITLNLSGTTSSFQVSYGLSTDGNVVSVADGGTLNFGAVPLNSTVTATVFIQNAASGSGTLSSVAVSGSAFRAVSVPLLPATLGAGQSASFQIQYSPLQVGSDSGSLTVVAGGKTINIAIQGTAIASNFVYSLSSGDKTQDLIPGQTTILPDIPVGQTVTYTVQGRNTSNQLLGISLVSLTGVGFALVDSPSLPLQVAPGAAFSVVFSVTPAQAGALVGRLRIGSDSFTFNLNGLGPLLIFSYKSGSSSTTVLPGGSFIFNPTTVGDKSTIDVTIQNTGTTAASISSIGISGPSGVFSAQGLPAFPTTINPQASLNFQLQFAPTTIGQATGTLLVNAQQFTLTGFGSAPSPASGLVISGPTSVPPFQQTAISVSLTKPYPLPLKGVLIMRVSPDGFGADPAVQFSTGGQTTTFTIPANQTQAIFANGSTQIRIQSGTVSGQITLSATLATDPGGVDVTPAPVQSLIITVPRQAPVIISGSVTSASLTGFTIAVVGFSTSRSLTKIVIQLTGVQGSDFKDQSITVNVEQVSLLWFNNSGSTQYGGQFRIDLPFTVTGKDAATVARTVQSIQSVGATLVNETGSSNPVTINLR